VISVEYCQLLARYNRWMNERLYALCAELPDAERKRDRGAFFGSIHGTLNHLLSGDRMWLGRFTDEWDELVREREITDTKLLRWAGSVTPEWLAGTLVYTSRVDGKTRELPRAVAAVHLFNHGTHHRGQLTTLMKQAGCDPGITDLPWLPGVVRIVETAPG
jgi:uncharacterized damage-inducible protein DinB